MLLGPGDVPSPGLVSPVQPPQPSAPADLPGPPHWARSRSIDGAEESWYVPPPGPGTVTTHRTLCAECDAGVARRRHACPTPRRHEGHHRGQVRLCGPISSIARICVTAHTSDSSADRCRRRVICSTVLKSSDRPSGNDDLVYCIEVPRVALARPIHLRPRKRAGLVLVIMSISAWLKPSFARTARAI
jgi:hypothetical protein